MNRENVAHVSIGDNGAVWINDNAGNIFWIGNNDNNDNFSQEVEGNLVQLDVG